MLNPTYHNQLLYVCSLLSDLKQVYTDSTTNNGTGVVQYRDELWDILSSEYYPEAVVGVCNKCALWRCFQYGTFSIFSPKMSRWRTIKLLLIFFSSFECKMKVVCLLELDPPLVVVLYCCVGLLPVMW